MIWVVLWMVPWMPSSTCCSKPILTWIRLTALWESCSPIFSIAFNTIQPTRLRGKLKALQVDPSATSWVIYLTDRPQFVRLRGCVSEELVSSRGLYSQCSCTRNIWLSVQLWHLATCRNSQMFYCCGVYRSVRGDWIQRTCGSLCGMVWGTSHNALYYQNQRDDHGLENQHSR